VPRGYTSRQSAPHAIPLGALSTVPAPLPSRVTVRVTGGVKVAMQARPAVMLTTPSRQSASPLQPANTDPAAALAKRITWVSMA
jgi:hypothetical protein